MLAKELMLRGVGRILPVVVFLMCGFIPPATSSAQQIPINLDEEKVGPYTLPDPLVKADGRKVTTSEDWINERRPELIRIFEDQVYGKVPQPPKPVKPTFHILSEDKQALGGTAIRREVTIEFLVCPHHGILRRHRTGLRRRLSKRSAAPFLPRGSNAARSR
jgi:hypothetical protein